MRDSLHVSAAQNKIRAKLQVTVGPLSLVFLYLGLLVSLFIAQENVPDEYRYYKYRNDSNINPHRHPGTLTFSSIQCRSRRNQQGNKDCEDRIHKSLL
jgi:hypothetical protein